MGCWQCRRGEITSAICQLRCAKGSNKPTLPSRQSRVRAVAHQVQLSIFLILVSLAKAYKGLQVWYQYGKIHSQNRLRIFCGYRGSWCKGRWVANNVWLGELGTYTLLFYHLLLLILLKVFPFDDGSVTLTLGHLRSLVLTYRYEQLSITESWKWIWTACKEWWTSFWLSWITRQPLDQRSLLLLLSSPSGTDCLKWVPHPWVCNTR